MRETFSRESMRFTNILISPHQFQLARCIANMADRMKGKTFDI